MKRLISKMESLKARIKDLSKERKLIRLKLLKGEIKARESFESLRALHASRSRLRSPIRIRRVCSVTGRARGVYSFFSLCGREIIRKFNKGFLPGVQKSSW